MGLIVGDTTSLNSVSSSLNGDNNSTEHGSIGAAKDRARKQALRKYLQLLLIFIVASIIISYIIIGPIVLVMGSSEYAMKYFLAYNFSHLQNEGVGPDDILRSFPVLRLWSSRGSFLSSPVEKCT